MMTKNFDVNQIKYNFLCEFITYNDFLNMQTNVIFENEFIENFNINNEKLTIHYKNKKYIDRFQQRKIKNPVINIFINNNYVDCFPAIEMERLNYSGFISYLITLCPNDYVPEFYKQRKEQMTMEDFGL